MSIKGVKLKSENLFLISPGVLELWKKNLRGADSAPLPPVQIGLKDANTFYHDTKKINIGRYQQCVSSFSV